MLPIGYESINKALDGIWLNPKYCIMVNQQGMFNPSTTILYGSIHISCRSYCGLIRLRYSLFTY